MISLCYIFDEALGGFEEHQVRMPPRYAAGFAPRFEVWSCTLFAASGDQEDMRHDIDARFAPRDVRPGRRI